MLLIADQDHARIREFALAESDIHWEERDNEILAGRTINSLNIELSVVTPADAPHRMLLATGSKDHLRDLERFATTKGFKLTAAGLLDAAGDPVQAKTETDLYAALGLAFVPAPLREAGLTFRSLFEGGYSEPLTLKDFRGILHNHTTYSDGHNSLREMAEAMVANGYEFLGIADHSQVAAYANGLTPDRVRKQWEEIDALNESLSPFKILKGTEVDILPDGSLDFDDELLAGFDFVVASIHSGFKMTVEAATDRLCRALESPHVDILGHPTGRLLLKRDGYEIDHEKVIACAAEHGKAIELNANPQRLDIDWRWLMRCIELEIPIPINPDAHSIIGLQDIRYGVEVAAKGPLPARLCPSCWSAEEFLDWCRSHA
jgi:DNA polymerase (family 10)